MTEAKDPPVTWTDANRRYPGTHEAQERFAQLAMRDQLARSYAKLRASGTYDPAEHGKGDTEPLTVAEHLELVATGEMLARYYRSPNFAHRALQAGATWQQIADARGTTEGDVRSQYREWAAGQHCLWVTTGSKFGLGDAEYAAALARCDAQ